ncbi:hypothetical protein F5X68DRAFT_69280 [Plectosphaerella plurivora]|uniref:Uncharacterized protein n=1 Tax=Plectosphaerella plurivora TaxID=936078 RepID=A0A9P8VFP1_9PEZI|nr:hypothetical protein F5X68DRAFT_69280 [Plectosphaerella plurivora]
MGSAAIILAGLPPSSATHRRPRPAEYPWTALAWSRPLTPGVRLQEPTVARIALSLNMAGQACLQEGRAAPSLALLDSRSAPGWPMLAPWMKREVHQLRCASPRSSSPFATALTWLSLWLPSSTRRSTPTLMTPRSRLGGRHGPRRGSPRSGGPMSMRPPRRRREEV